MKSGFGIVLYNEVVGSGTSRSSPVKKKYNEPILISALQNII
jgi:hypothetical protein